MPAIYALMHTGAHQASDIRPVRVRERVRESENRSGDRANRHGYNINTAMQKRREDVERERARERALN